MNIKNIVNAGLLGLGLVSTSMAGSKMVMEHEIHQATYIQLKVNKGQETNLADFLKKGSALVRETEPQTKLWFALQGEEGAFGIFDVFHDDAGRATHFAGKVAAALHDNATALVEGGWDKGVLANVQNSIIITTNNYQTLEVLKATKASYILLKAKEGKGDELTALLKSGAGIINKTEPHTSFWLALKLDENTYAIFDAFTDEVARTTHFEGAVAGALKAHADNLIVGGWQGVLTNVHNFNIIASS